MEKKPSEGLSRTSIGDLLDDELTEILIRLPSCESAITCKLVSKRWLSLLSNPKFAIRYVKHKEEVEKEGLPWTLLSLAKQKLVNDDANETDKSFIDTHNKVFYNSRSKFSLKFLGRKLMIVATFKDLMLCFDTSRGCYLICNPVTKTWVALPPTTTSLDFHDKAHCWACLTCEDPFDPTNNNNNTTDGGGYRFRIVVVPFSTTAKLSEGYKTSPFTTVNAIVFCSDNSQWIDIQVRVPLIAKNCERVERVRAVLCKGMVCLHYDFHFGLFNPFDVTPGGTTALEARALPIPKPKFARSRLLECGGKLISVLPSPSNRCRMDKEGNLLVDYQSGIHVHLLYKELDLNQLVVGSNTNTNTNTNELSWKAQCGGGGSECIDKTGRSRSLLSGLLMTNVHPRNSHLLFIVTASSELLLCDRRSSSLKTLGRCEFRPPSIHLRLELQHWPTPVPTILASNTN